MNKSKNLYRDIFIGVSFVAGVFGFMSGEFIVSTMLFALASLTSNLDLDGRFRA
ncbi:MAG: hypothetical protein PHW13_11885 [Methylococcales bacterium]|nr:hypothetical protein [Methylococcales bacterium]